MTKKPPDGLWLLLEAPDRFGGKKYLVVNKEDTAFDLEQRAVQLFRERYENPQDLTLIDWSLDGRAIDAGPGRYTRQMREAIAAILEEIELEDT
jgi:hypothetical protein